MIELEALIKRFITLKINSVKVRDINYARKYIIEEFESILKLRNDQIEIKKLYQDYLLGYDVMALLNNDRFYEELEQDDYPWLFGREKEEETITVSTKNNDSESTEDVRDYWDRAFLDFKIKRNLIPDARKFFIKATRKYIAFMELRRWVEEKGFVKIEVKPNLSIELTSEIDYKMACMKLQEEQCSSKNTQKRIENSDASNSDDYFKGKTNQFNNVPLGIISKYFMQLSEHPKTKFLTVEEVNLFIDRAFCFNHTIEKLSFHSISRKHGAIWKLFHHFYEDCATNLKYDIKKKAKKEYVELITSNFTNWQFDKVSNNFAIRNEQNWLRIKDLL